MRRIASLNHSLWECKYHVVFIPKYRKKSIFGPIRAELGEIFKRLAEQRQSQIEEGEFDWKAFFEFIDQYAPSASFIPEIWQGHKNENQGAWLALQKHENISPTFTQDSRGANV